MKRERKGRWGQELRNKARLCAEGGGPSASSGSLGEGVGIEGAPLETIHTLFTVVEASPPTTLALTTQNRCRVSPTLLKLLLPLKGFLITIPFRQYGGVVRSQTVWVCSLLLPPLSCETLGK